MHAKFEPLSGVVRVFDNGKNYGEDYTWAATCRFIDLKTVEILGIIKAPTPNEWRVIVKTMLNMGVANIIYTRYKNGKPKIKNYNITKSRINDANKTNIQKS